MHSKEEQKFCAKCYAVKTEQNKCPKCELGYRTYNVYCKRCMYVHLNVFTRCKPWSAKVA